MMIIKNPIILNLIKKILKNISKIKKIVLKNKNTIQYKKIKKISAKISQ